jgi:hypothetical protein
MPRKSTQVQEQQPQEAIATREPGDDSVEVEQKAPNPRSWAHNNAAGVEMLEHRDPYERWIKFRDGKPPQDVIDYLKDNGFRWNASEKVWARPVGYNTQSQDRLAADRTYKQVVELLLTAKGIEPEHEADIPGPF